jgi:NADH:ubiquinone oxidoreductase subunit H
MRAITQYISYEICILFVLFPLFFTAGSFDLSAIVLEQVKSNCSNFSYFFCNAILFFICILAETNRIPFDLPEAEGELVAGYNVEYSGIPFALFFLAEYLSMFN